MASDQRLASLLDRLESVTNRLEKISVGKGGQSASDEGNTEIVEGFDQSVQPCFNTFYELSNQIGGDVSKHVALVRKAVEAERELIVIASKCKQPEQSTASKLLKPLSDAISAVQDFREKNRGSKQFNHLSAVSEFIPCLGWVAVYPKPVNYIKQIFEATQFYSNKVLKEFKETDAKQADWAKLFAKITISLSSYVTDFHTTGLTWNVDGKIATPSAVAGPAPPPPPPPAAAPVIVASKRPADSRSALLSDLNRGDEVTKGLRKVTNDMKTHKNPALRAAGVVSISSKPVKSAVAPKVVKLPPVFRLEGKKWVVEYHNGKQDIVISETNMKQTVYVYKCDNCVIQVKGKVNSIAIDSCKKTVVIFDNVISLVDFVNCQSVKAQANGAVPTISIGKTDGIQVYCSEAAMSATIISSKSSEMNVLIPGKDGDMIENAIPEQYRTVWNESKKCFDTNQAEITA